MFKIFKDGSIEDLEAEVNDWLIHTGVRIVNWDLNIQEKTQTFVMIVEYAWLTRND